MRRLCVLALACLCACVAPARSLGAYEGKAARTAEDAASAAQTALLAIRTARMENAFAPTISVLLAEAEKDATAVQGTFDSVQPPDDPSDALRDRLDEMLTDLTGILGDLRIAARRGKLDTLASIAKPLPSLAKKLYAFSEEHQ